MMKTYCAMYFTWALSGIDMYDSLSSFPTLGNMMKSTCEISNGFLILAWDQIFPEHLCHKHKWNHYPSARMHDLKNIFFILWSTFNVNVKCKLLGRLFCISLRIVGQSQKKEIEGVCDDVELTGFTANLSCLSRGP